MNPFALTPAQWCRAALLGVLMAVAYLALEFGVDVWRLVKG